MAGGGSGGHVVPALAVARELALEGHQPHFIGTRRGMEARLVPAEGYPIDWIEIGGLNRVGLAKALTSLSAIPGSVVRSLFLLGRLKPAAIFSMGGYVAGPVLIAAVLRRIPIIAMEPNAVPGLTHRRLAKRFERALVTFPETARLFPRSEVTGLPVRHEFFQIPPLRRGERLTVLITGGSQGSRTLNRAAEASWPLWEPGEVRLIHQTGRAAFEEIEPRFAKATIDGELVPFFDEIAAKFAEADIIVCRSGMGTVTELSASGRPSILVPLPTSADDHQRHNAEAMVRAGGGRMVLDRELTGPRLVEEIRSMAAEPGLLAKMGESAHGIAKPDAARRAARILAEYAS